MRVPFQVGAKVADAQIGGRRGQDDSTVEFNGRRALEAKWFRLEWGEERVDARYFFNPGLVSNPDMSGSERRSAFNFDLGMPEYLESRPRHDGHSHSSRF